MQMVLDNFFSLGREEFMFSSVSHKIKNIQFLIYVSCGLCLIYLVNLSIHPYISICSLLRPLIPHPPRGEKIQADMRQSLFKETKSGLIMLIG